MLLAALRTSTTRPRGPGTAPLIRSSPRSASTACTVRDCTVVRIPPIRPAIRTPLNTRPGVAQAPIEPGERCLRWVPCEEDRPLKPCRFMTPAKPLPLLLPVTSTCWPLANTSAVTSCPSVYSDASSVRSSARYLRGVRPAFSNSPLTGLVTLRGSISPKPSCAAEYPSRSGVRTPVTTHGPACTTVTGTICPASLKTWVMPSLVPRIPLICLLMSVRSSELDLDVDARGKVEAHQRVHRLRRRVEDVDQPLVRPHLEVLTRVLVLVRRADDAVHVLLGRQRHRASHPRAGTRHGVDDLPRRAVDDLVVICLEPDADLLSRHGGLGVLRFSVLVLALGASPPGRPSGCRARRVRPEAGPARARAYLMIFVTRPAPTVRPPSRIANRRPSSMAMGWIRSTCISGLSPGITISVPSGRFTTPVTSVVRK